MATVERNNFPFTKKKKLHSATIITFKKGTFGYLEIFQKHMDDHNLKTKELQPITDSYEAVLKLRLASYEIYVYWVTNISLSLCLKTKLI